MQTLIRDAKHNDSAALADIYNDVVLTTTANWDIETVTVQDRELWLNTRQQNGFPVLVSENQGRVTGYASYGPFRPHHGYRHSVEHSVHIAADARGQGLGRRLMTELLARAEQSDVHVVVGAIEAENQASLNLHRTLGFNQTARLSQVGRKFDRWLDLVFVQKILD